MIWALELGNHFKKNADDPLHAFSTSSGILKNRGSYYEQIRRASVDNEAMDISQ